MEEFAARLGKKIEEAKPTNDLVDIVLKGQPVISTAEDWMPSKAERLSNIADRAFEIEREISPSPFSISNLKLDIEDETKKQKPAKSPAKKVSKTKEVKELKQTKKMPKAPAKTKPAAKKTKTSSDSSLREEVRIVFKKALTDREQKVFDYFVDNSNKIVYAKDLANLLELPRDYVYKYIKNLRAKIEGDKLDNADKGGFILHV